MPSDDKTNTNSAQKDDVSSNKKDGKFQYEHNVKLNMDSDFLNPSADKDPNMAALIAILCMCLLGLPGLAYLYLGNTRKALVHVAIPLFSAICLGILVVVSWASAIFTFGLSAIGLCLVVPLCFLFVLYNFAIIIDVYKIAKHEKPLLPQL